MDEESMEQFRIVCLKCQRLDVKHHTVLYVDWDRRIYMLLCEECGSVEHFNELGRRIRGRKKREGEIN